MNELAEKIIESLCWIYNFDEETKIEISKKINLLDEETLNNFAKLILDFKAKQIERQKELLIFLQKQNNNIDELIETESEQDLQKLFSNL